jgi:hypothetical protein
MDGSEFDLNGLAQSGMSTMWEADGCNDAMKADRIV